MKPIDTILIAIRSGVGLRTVLRGTGNPFRLRGWIDLRVPFTHEPGQKVTSEINSAGYDVDGIRDKM